ALIPHLVPPCYSLAHTHACRVVEVAREAGPDRSDQQRKIVRARSAGEQERETEQCCHDRRPPHLATVARAKGSGQLIRDLEVQSSRLDGAVAGAERRQIGIRFQLAPGDEGALALGYSPLFSAVPSLHVLVEPKHHALQHEWVRAARSFRAGLRREIAALSFLYRWTLPNHVLPSAHTGFDDFAAELARLRALKTETAAFELLRPL